MKVPDKVSKQIRDKYSIANNTFVRRVKKNPADNIEVEVGDSKQPDFKPQVKIMRWDNEVNFSVRYKDDIDNPFEVPIVETRDKTISYRKNNKEVHFYELDPDNLNEDGGYEFEVIFNEKPASNVIEFTIETKELDFFYQPALTEEEIKGGASRPDNVVGSYAVYHKSKANNQVGGKEYKAGKAFHIYRPKIIDKNGDCVWGEINIDEQKKLLTITIPDKFLTEAVYPIIVDPTFGFQTLGASGRSFSSTGDLYSSRYTGANVGDNTYNRIYVGYSSTDTDADSFFYFRSVIYSAVSNTPFPDTITRLAYSDEFSWSGTVAQTWKETVISDVNTLSSVSGYWLSILGKLTQTDPPDNFYVRYDTQSSTINDSSSVNYGVPPLNPSLNDDNDFRYSIYATYTASGGGSSSIKKLSSIAQASIKKISGIALASVKKVAGVTNA